MYDFRKLHNNVLSVKNPNPEGKLVIDSFRGDYSFLSNFYESPITIDGITYNNVESAFQAQKTFDLSEKEQFINCKGGTAKKLGKKVKLRNDWEHVKCGIMLNLVLEKFKQNPELKNKLLETNGYLLIEGNNWRDYYWGVCNGKGSNRLGVILMLVRRHLLKIEN